MLEDALAKPLPTRNGAGYPYSLAALGADKGMVAKQRGGFIFHPMPKYQ